MNKKEQICELNTQGFDTQTICKIVGVSDRYVRKILNANSITSQVVDKPLLTVKNYIKAVNNGYDTKNNLPTQFRVTKKTLLQFEKESGVLALLAKAEHIQGKSYEEIKTKLHLRERIIDSFNIHQLPTIQQMKNELSQILAVYEKMAEVDDSYVAKSSSIKSIIQKL